MAVTFTGAVPVPKAQSSPLSVLITGASRGIGFELVRQYAAAHRDNIVFAGVRTPSKAVALKQLSEKNGNVHIITLDVDSEDSVKKSVAQVEAVTDHVDLLINNAGVLGEGDSNNTLKVTAQQLNAIFNTNVTGVLLTTQSYLSLLHRSTSPKVVNISTSLGSHVHANKFGAVYAGYGVSKAALNFLTTAFRYSVPDVTFLAVHPGWVSTDMGRAASGGTVEPPTTVEGSAQAIRYYVGEKDLASSGEYVDAMTGEIIPF